MFRFTVRFSTRSGGYRQLYDIDYNRISSLETYNGHVDAKSVEFKFDFIAPLHCSEQESHIRCKQGEEPLILESDITQVVDLKSTYILFLITIQFFDN